MLVKGQRTNDEAQRTNDEAHLRTHSEYLDFFLIYLYIIWYEPLVRVANSRVRVCSSMLIIHRERERLKKSTSSYQRGCLVHIVCTLELVQRAFCVIRMPVLRF